MRCSAAPVKWLDLKRLIAPTERLSTGISAADEQDFDRLLISDHQAAARKLDMLCIAEPSLDHVRLARKLALAPEPAKTRAQEILSQQLVYLASSEADVGGVKDNLNCEAIDVLLKLAQKAPGDRFTQSRLFCAVANKVLADLRDENLYQWLKLGEPTSVFEPKNINLSYANLYCAELVRYLQVDHTPANWAFKIAVMLLRNGAVSKEAVANLETACRQLIKRKNLKQQRQHDCTTILELQLQLEDESKANPTTRET